MLRDKVSRNLGVSRDPTDPRNPGLGVSRDPSDPRNLITLKNNGLSLPSDGSLNKKWLNSELNSIEKVTGWQMSGSTPWLEPTPLFYPRLGLGRGRAPSYEALKGAVTDLYRLDDFQTETLGEGFFSDVYKVTHKTTGRVMVLKMNKHKSNRTNMLKEIQLMNKLKHPNILRFEAVCVHEGQLHALTEYVAGCNLEQLLEDKDIELPWSIRIELALHIAKGILYLNSQGFFHRDLTSKNILIKKEPRLTAIVGDFGLATRIPKPSEPRLHQVGSPYWMSPECLKGEHYDQTADIFSYGIILCELIARVNSDPDTLPRTQNFGVDYIAFSELCPSVPPEFLKLAFTCVSIDPVSRPRVTDLVNSLKQLLEEQRQAERQLRTEEPQHHRFIALKRYMSEGEVTVKKSPSEKARLHSIYQNSTITAKSIGMEMCQLDPHYTPTTESSVNPFATLPRLREGRKIIGSTWDLFSSCFEVPSPRVSSPVECPGAPVRSLPSSPTNPHREPPCPPSRMSPCPPSLLSSCFSPIRTSEPSGQRRVSLLKKMYCTRGCVSQDDSALGLSSSLPPFSLPLRRWGSVESGFCSTSDDWFSGPISSRSICSSLLTVSDLEEDLRVASAFLTKKRTSSVFTDSIDDLSSRLDDISNTGSLEYRREGYEKDIRDIVEYFERNCRTKEKPILGERELDLRTSPEIARSQKIESLIKRVAENKNRARLRRHTPAQNLQVCDGIVTSKLQLFDANRRQPRARFESGFVKSRRAMFDTVPTKPGRKLVSDFLRQREPKVSKLASTQSQEIRSKQI